MSAEALLRELRSQLPSERLLTEREQIAPFECDALPVYCARPVAVVLAQSEADVVAVAGACHRHRVPLVTRGAGTGLSAGAKPIEAGVLLVTAAMNRILELNQHAMTARVEPGAVNLQVSRAAAPLGLYYAPDPSSQIACSIGGNVAENAGGVHCLKYGVTVQNVAALRVVTSEGEVLSIGSQCLAQPGYDLLALLHGSEGCLGIITEVTVKLTPLPATTRTLMADFACVRAASDAVSAIVRAGVIPAALEMMDALAISATEAFCHAGYALDAAAILIIDLDGDPREVEAELKLVEGVLGSSGATRVQLAEDDAQRALWWKGRKSAFPAIGRLSPDYYCIDGTVPRHRIGDVLEAIQSFAVDYQLRVANVFHAGDGNLHPIIMFDGREPDALERVEGLAAEILEYCIAVGGSITGEHGVGLEKINQMAVQFSDAEIAQFIAVKEALDPVGLLNPDKQIPELARCQEYRALRHAHE
ncbi:FAD-binding oxidoreductase [Microbulbifer flavimaris]|uniref:FAD-binding oxidoreductase n=1 Tax=Microbulbifer flavimaris TaxID=1781068 RepID=A0ABX4I400_9GAMM|nr:MULTISPECIES: FAD-linked oxidase C-terminal domain-containing protein [Microbulbifer]KUJ84545.1 glycolate oxidase subunit GlcD [Microbulbifer sp. ZGT114]PCO06632.1 FAD-binding oxidoreductase [Microbulbifer flavimaris]